MEEVKGRRRARHEEKKRGVCHLERLRNYHGAQAMDTRLNEALAPAARNRSKLDIPCNGESDTRRMLSDNFLRRWIDYG